MNKSKKLKEFEQLWAKIEKIRNDPKIEEEPDVKTSRGTPTTEEKKK